jgi:hypothetical protein
MRGSSSKDGSKTSCCIAAHCSGIHVGLLWIKATGLVLAVQMGQDTYRSPIEDDARVPDTTFGSEEDEFCVRILRMVYSERGKNKAT